MGRPRNSWFALESAVLADEEGTHHMSNGSTEHCQESRVSGLCLAGVARPQSMEDPVAI